MDKSGNILTLNELNIEGYEKVVEVKVEGLHAIIAIHDSTLGPALGGIRAYPYATFEQGLEDALRLSKGMTYKAAVSETGTGGGKSVIFTDYRVPKSEETLFAFAEAVNSFGGNYICAEDFGMGLADLEVVCKKTRYAVGLPKPKSSGDPSPYTAFGGFCGIQAAAKALWGSDSVAGRTFAIQGLGSVGMRLAHLLFWHGANLIVADVNAAAVQRAVAEFGAQAVAPDEIVSVKCDMLVPCALGAILNKDSIPNLRCKAVAGLANNQLHTDQDGETLFQKGILYAPDYVINAGGLLTVCTEIEPEGFDPKNARGQVEKVYELLTNIFARSSAENKPTHQIANEIAEHNVKMGIGKRTQQPVFRS